MKIGKDFAALLAAHDQYPPRGVDDVASWVVGSVFSRVPIVNQDIDYERARAAGAEPAARWSQPWQRHENWWSPEWTNLARSSEAGLPQDWLGVVADWFATLEVIASRDVYAYAPTEDQYAWLRTVSAEFFYRRQSVMNDELPNLLRVGAERYGLGDRGLPAISARSAVNVNRLDRPCQPLEVRAEQLEAFAKLTPRAYLRQNLEFDVRLSSKESPPPGALTGFVITIHLYGAWRRVVV